jgi:hypothetical protein
MRRDAYLENLTGDIKAFILELISEGQQRKVAYIYGRGTEELTSRRQWRRSLSL